MPTASVGMAPGWGTVRRRDGMLPVVENSRPGWMRAADGPPGAATTRSSILALADQVVVSAVNFLTGVIIGRACSKEEFGLYMLGFSIVFVVTTLQNSLILTPYMISSPRLQGRAHAQYAGSTLVHQLGLSVLTMLALTAGGLLLELGIGPEELAPVLWALVGVVAFVLSRECARQICFARLRMEMAFLLDCCVAVVQIAGLGLLAYFHLLSASSAWWMAGAASCLATLGWLLWMRQNLVVRITAVLADLRRNWSFGKWVFASGVAWALTMYLYPWILVGFHGNASAGSWAACLGIIGITNPIVVGVQNFLGPSIAHASAGGDFAALRRHVLKAAATLTTALLPVFAPLLLFGGWLVVLVYGESYAGDGPAVCGLTLSALAGGLTFVFSRALFAVERAQTDFWANVVSLAVLLAVGLWLVDFYGVTGAAFGLLLGNVMGLLVRCLGFLRMASGASAPVGVENP